MGNKNNKIKSKVLNFIAALVCGALGGNLLIYSIGRVFISKNVFYEEYLFGPLFTWTSFGVGLVFILAAFFFIREYFE